MPFLHRFLFGLFWSAVPYTWNENKGGVSMRKCDSFMGRLFLLCVSNIGLQLLGFVYRIFLSRFAGAEGLGVYRLAFSAYIVIHAATLSGVTMACTRLSAEWSAQGRAGAVRQLVYRAARTFLCFFLCAGTILLGFRDWIGTELLGDGRTVDAMPIMLVCILLTGVENILKSTMIGMNRVDNAAASELTEQIVRIGATIALLSFEQTADLGRIAVLIFTGMAISECVSAAMMVHMYRGLRLPAHCPPPIGKDPFWKIVLPVSASALVTNGIASAGAVILPTRLVASGLSRTEAISALGIVSGIASPIMFLPIALLASLCTVAMPQASRYASKHNQSRLQHFTSQSLFATGIVGIPATALLLPLAPVIARLFFYRAVPTGYFWLIGLSAIFCYYQMITGCLLNGIGRQQFTVMSALSGEALQLILVYLMAGQPHLRVYGYLIAQCIAPIYVVLCNLIRLVSCGALVIRLQRFLGAPLLCGFAVWLWTRIFYSFFVGWLGGQWMGLCCAVVCSIALYLCFLRLFDIKIEKYLSVRGRPMHDLMLFY